MIFKTKSEPALAGAVFVVEEVRGLGDAEDNGVEASCAAIMQQKTIRINSFTRIDEFCWAGEDRTIFMKHNSPVIAVAFEGRPTPWKLNELKLSRVEYASA